MSTSDAATDFEAWIEAEFASNGSFTALIVLVQITEAKVDPLVSTYLNIIGTEVDWAEIAGLFAGAGVPWNGAAFFSVVDIHGGPLDNPAARQQLRELEARVNADRLVLNQGAFFDQWGRKLQVEEMDLQ